MQPTCINSEPRYVLVDQNAPPYDKVLPERGFYNSIVLSSPRYYQMSHEVGQLTTVARYNAFNHSFGQDTSATFTDPEGNEYQARVLINANGFDYPVEYIMLDILKHNKFVPTIWGAGVIAGGIAIDTSHFQVIDGAIYFTDTLDNIVRKLYPQLDAELAKIDPAVHIVYYHLRILFPLEVPDTTEDTHRLALAQASTYAVLDCINQYEQARAISQMKAEIAYTETLTFFSTILATALNYFRSYTIQGSDQFIKQIGVEVAKGATRASYKAIFQALMKELIKGAFKEVLEEIIKDGFIETLSENIVDILGGPEELGFWISSLATSGRETMGPIGNLALNLKSDVSVSNLIRQAEAGDVDAQNQLKAKMDEMHAQQQQ